MPARPALPLDESAGAVAVLGAAARLLPALPGVVGAYVLLALVTLVSQDAANLLSLPINAYAVTAAYRELGGDPADGNSFGVRVLLVLVAGLVTGLAVLLGFVVLVVPGIYLLVRLRLVVASVMLEDSGPLEALGRSLTLTRSQFWTVFGVSAVPVAVLVVVTLVTALSAGTLSSGGLPDLAAVRGALRVGGAVSTLVADPIAVTANAVLFALYDEETTGCRTPTAG
ncbi:MAG: hypothetical protein A07HB70_01726 [uncultured archaeon A07HB70]|nr:MAG: hypothetical protein A07HB70_01726 [uncultured archaeon A07HB70]